MMNHLASNYMPPIIRRCIRNILSDNIKFEGPFENWCSAKDRTGDYSQGAILDRVSIATSEVLSGAATYEQDGKAFCGTPPPSNALNGLLLAAGLGSGRLNVLDFGGGLGSHFLRWRPFLSAIPQLRWHVLEQSNYTELGRALFKDVSNIEFHSRSESIESSIDAVLASSVLQYVDEPCVKLEMLLQFKSQIFILDRTLLGEQDLAMVQSTPKRMGGTSYPVWILNKSRIFSRLENDYDCLTEFQGSDEVSGLGKLNAKFSGSIWKRRS